MFCVSGCEYLEKKSAVTETHLKMDVTQGAILKFLPYSKPRIGLMVYFFYQKSGLIYTLRPAIYPNYVPIGGGSHKKRMIHNIRVHYDLYLYP